MFAMCRFTIDPRMRSMVEDYLCHLRSCVQSPNRKLSQTTSFNGSMVIWVSTIIFQSIPTCIPTKCEINLGPKFWYNMRLKNKFHITKMNNKTSYQIWPRWFWILGIFTFSCEGTRLQMFHSIGESSWLRSPFRNSEIRACEMYAHSTSIICAPPCRTSFFHTKSMLLKGDFFGFWISIYWDFEARPIFETMPWADCTRKNNELILMSKILYLQYVELHVNCHIQY
jgi:hypothetical protein